jgi:hypothetical protein
MIQVAERSVDFSLYAYNNTFIFDKETHSE